MAKFTVDTHLFRELGELLVGRDSTALAELIKNAYDADATLVTVYGEGLDQPEKGRIVITDDGLGMRRDQFEKGFLRVASRFKEQGVRRSLRYGRRYTGAKGIGRLAAHKLAHVIDIVSVPADELRVEDEPESLEPFSARIDWDRIEELETLDEVADSGAIYLSPLSSNSRAEEEDGEEVDEEVEGEEEAGRKAGTVITLSHLRRRWTERDRTHFLAEVTGFEPPLAIIVPPSSVDSSDLLFQRPYVRDESRGNPSVFRIELTGEFDTGDEYWKALADASEWVIDIDAQRPETVGSKKIDHDEDEPSQAMEGSEAPKTPRIAPKVIVKVVPTASTARKYGVGARSFEIDHPSPEDGPFFQARLFNRLGRPPSIVNKRWLDEASGIRVFMEGFRVLPYGAPGDDWLSLDADYGHRSVSTQLLEKYGFSVEAPQDSTRVIIQPSRQYFGGVFCTVSNSKDLTMLVNREGFLPNASFFTLKDLVRAAIDIGTRVRALATQETAAKRSEMRDQAAADRDRARREAEERKSLKEQVEEGLERATTLAAEARQQAAQGDYDGAGDTVARVTQEVRQSVEKALQLQSEGSTLRVLASVGLQLTAFVHEINALRNASRDLSEAAERLASVHTLAPDAKRDASFLRQRLGDFTRDLERQASYLVDVTSADARRRRSRQKMRERLEAAARVVAPAMEAKRIALDNEIPENSETPPMFRSEITVVFTNLLTNAIKAAGEKGRIKAESHDEEDGTTVLRLENTGVQVDIDDSERLFRAFESTTVSVDPVLGQGMGMGLPITRNLLGEYGASIRFVPPSAGFVTAVEIRFKR